MKRILGILALTLVLFSACKKKTPSGYTDYLVVGFWVCTVSDCDGTITENPPYYIDAMRDHKVRFYDGAYSRDLYWKLNGEQLIITGDGECPEIALKSLTSRHMTWEKYWYGQDYLESYTNLGEIFQGLWRISYKGDWYAASVNVENYYDNNGTSYWKKNGTGSLIDFTWQFSQGERPTISFNTQTPLDDLPMAFSVPLTSVSDDIIKGELNTYEIVFERQ